MISEAAVAGVPVLASRMDGNVGLLGADYPGYFPVGDTEALARLLERLEREPRFVARFARRSPAARRSSGPRARSPRGGACWRGCAQLSATTGAVTRRSANAKFVSAPTMDGSAP